MTANTDEIKIAPAHFPVVSAGAYAIKAGLESEIGVFSEQLEFIVGGYNYHIPANEVLAVYPPIEGTGNYAGTFPHVQFRRSTIPWEYEQYNGENTKEKRTPYLFLVLLEERELEPGKVGILFQKTSQLSGADEQDKELQILTFSKAHFHLLPDAETLLKTTHVRVQEHQEIAYLDLPGQTSILVAARMVRPGVKYRAFVCSYVNYTDDRYHLMTDIHHVKQNDVVHAIGLYEWNFTSGDVNQYQLNEKKLSGYAGLDFDHKEYIPHPVLNSMEELKAYLKELSSEECYDKLLSLIGKDDKLSGLLKYDGKTLKGMLNALHVSSFNTSIHVDEELDKLIGLGKVPLLHQLRAGGKLISLYQGPFVSRHHNFYFREFLPDKPDPGIQPFSVGKHLPDHADKLILWNENTKMLDMTYAAAWQLGRLLIMNNNKVLQELKKWKEKLVLNKLIEKQNQTTHLFQVRLNDSAAELPILLTDFIADILKFRNFPVYYLLPHKSYCPEETCRYFKMDNSWILALLFGIFSAGPELSIDTFKNSVLAVPSIESAFNYKKSYYGMVLNSQVIVNWPHVIVELSNSDDPENCLPYSCVANLNNKVRVYLSEKPFDKIRIYQKNENAFFGISYENKTDTKDYMLSFDQDFLPDVNNREWIKADGFPFTFLFRQPEVNFNILPYKADSEKLTE